jgi:YidC/Oxa1 family membrane protein insertase
MIYKLRKTNALVLLLKEIGAFSRFFFKTPKTEKMIVFYAEHNGYYPNFEGLIKELIDEHKQNLCYVTSDSHDPILKTSEPRIRTYYINRLLPFFMVFVNCKVFVMTMPDLNQYHIKRSINPVHYVYVFHCLFSTHMIYRDGAFDHYDSILCVGPHQVKEIRRRENLNQLPEKKLVEAGYYRLERIYYAYREHFPEKPSSSTKEIVLVAPSWGDANILEFCGERLIEILLDGQYEVIVRPHPETVRRSPDLISLFVSKFGNNPNFTLEKTIISDESLLRADILISDYSGITLEYAFGTERPVLFLDVPLKIKNQGFRELGIEPLELALREEIGIIVSPKNMESVPQVISSLIAKKVAYEKRLRELRKNNVYSFGQSAKIGAQYIIDLITDKNH